MTDEQKKERYPENGLGDEGEDRDESGNAAVTVRRERNPEKKVAGVCQSER